MSDRHSNGSQYESDLRASESTDVAAQAHRTATEDHDKQVHQTGGEHSREALEHSPSAQRHGHETHGKATNEHGIVLFGHQEIEALAYQLWLDRGRPDGSPQEDWYQAAERLRSRAGTASTVLSPVELST